MPNSKLLLEAALSETHSGAGSGILINTRSIESRSLGVSFMKNALLNKDDSLVISIKQPLRITSGSVGILMPVLDAEGFPVFSTEYVNLVPDGRELDYKIAYARPIGKTLAFNVQARIYKDLSNIRGRNDANVSVLLKSSFSL